MERCIHLRQIIPHDHFAYTRWQDKRNFALCGFFVMCSGGDDFVCIQIIDAG
jgi:hypothetical protein